jgi:hypothetical protein
MISGEGGASERVSSGTDKEEYCVSYSRVLRPNKSGDSQQSTGRVEPSHTEKTRTKGWAGGAGLPTSEISALLAVQTRRDPLTRKRKPPAVIRWTYGTQYAGRGTPALGGIGAVVRITVRGRSEPV